MDLRFLLSHHQPEHYDRCVRIGGQWVCARCLGLYPPMIVGFGLQLGLHRHFGELLQPRPWEAAILMALALPAVIDWVRGRVRPESGTNPGRLLTGLLLGVVLARTLYLNARAPLASPALDVILFLVVAVVLGDLIRYAFGGDGPRGGGAPSGGP